MATMDEATRKRLRAGRLMLVGKTPAEAAKAVGVARQIAYTWNARLDEGGIDALRVMATGRPAQLDASQLEGLRVALLQGPAGTRIRHRTMDTQARTSAHRAAVRRHLQRGACLAAAGRIGVQLAKARASSHRAQREGGTDQDAQDLARAQKKGASERRLIVFIDESGLSHRPMRVRTWAPKGCTPIIQYHFNWKHVSALAGLTRTHFLFRLHDGAIKSAQIVEFLKALRAQLMRKSIIVACWKQAELW